MRRGLLIGRLFGTDIYCEISFFLLIGLYMWLVGLAAGAIFSAAVLISVLVHEFGHVLAVRRLLKTESLVVLWILGGLTIDVLDENEVVGGAARYSTEAALAAGLRVGLLTTAADELPIRAWLESVTDRADVRWLPAARSIGRPPMVRSSVPPMLRIESRSGSNSSRRMLPRQSR